ncbi:transposase family protein [Microbacterium sp.]|uniref:transposase family protein n=1 Tax=Microbacterium sp. TaxID=51671 RepID=UPI003459F5E5
MHVVTADATVSACPACGGLSSSVKEHVRTRPRDIPYETTPLRLVWHKRRWRCAEASLGALGGRSPRPWPRCRPGPG